ncbi:helix-turn-helix transcriptional regulator [Erysipelothrix aquatica]|uniref:helix-turn-helix transcriptional regulator n=1 Tax=Erysipelothrix aquatica TaxID=2683714 RepID=UPI0013578A70|nr:helix-turn-helix transcriptional regulator [Erysipelothrix aquatica]
MNNIKKLREKKNVSQWTLSAYLEVSQETVSAYENNKALPSAKTLLKLAEYFNTSIDYILARTDIDFSIRDMSKDGLDEEDVKLLLKFRNLSRDNKNKVIGYIDAIEE